jgi:hypothetical protein
MLGVIVDLSNATSAKGPHHSVEVSLGQRCLALFRLIARKADSSREYRDCIRFIAASFTGDLFVHLFPPRATLPVAGLWCGVWIYAATRVLIG